MIVQVQVFLAQEKVDRVVSGLRIKGWKLGKSKCKQTGGCLLTILLGNNFFLLGDLSEDLEELLDGNSGNRRV